MFFYQKVQYRGKEYNANSIVLYLANQIADILCVSNNEVYW